MFYLGVPATDLNLRRAASMVTEARFGVSAAAKLLRGRVYERVMGPSHVELRVGTLSEPPVMLVHGLGADKSCFSTMEALLHRAGYTVFSVSYSCLDADIHACQVLGPGDAGVGHSLGGVVLRWAVRHTRMRDWVNVAITLGSPHRGTPTAHLAPSGLPGYGRIISQLRPGLVDVEDLGVADDPVRWVAIAAQYDWVVPARYATLPESGNVRNAVVSLGGHMTLTSNAECLAIIEEELAGAGGFSGREVPAVPEDSSLCA